MRGPRVGMLRIGRLIGIRVMGIIVYAMWLRVYVIVRGMKGLCGRSGYCRWTWSYDEFD